MDKLYEVRERIGTVTQVIGEGDRELYNVEFESAGKRLMDPRFAPIPLSSAINIGFFQIKTWELVEKAYDPSILFLKDWYLETPNFFGNSKTILEVLGNDPGLFFSIVFRDIGATVLIPLYLYSFLPVFSHTNIAIMSVSILLLLMLLIGMFKIYRAHGAAPLFILSVGCGSTIAAFLLTWFGSRYVVTLLPIFLLAYSHYLGDSERAAKISIYERRSFKSGLFILGCALLFSNEPFNANNERIADECTGAGNGSVFSKVYRGACTRWKRMQYQIGGAVDNNRFLNRERSVSMSSAFPVLSKLIDRTTRILSLENHFFAGFTDVGIDNNRQIWSLPPYDDKTEYTGNLLNEIDVMFVSDDWTTAAPSVSTQAYLRYKLHIVPYLNARKSEFSVVRVPSYGDAYVRKKRVQLRNSISMDPR